MNKALRRSSRVHQWPKVRTLVVVIAVLALSAPWGVLTFFRVFDTTVMRQTERELLAQSAMLVAAYQNEYVRIHPSNESAIEEWRARSFSDTRIDPAVVNLDVFAHDTLPPRPYVTKMMNAHTEAMSIGESLTPVVREARALTLASLKILDSRGVQVAGSPSEAGKYFGQIEEVRLALQGTLSARLRKRVSDEPIPKLSSLSRGAQVRLFIAMPIPHPFKEEVLGVVYSSRTPKRVVEVLYDFRTQLGLALGLLMLGGVLVLLLLYLFLTYPMQSLAKRLESYESNPMQLPTSQRFLGTEELAMIESSFQNLAMQLTGRLDNLERFAGHVSHEFKTPLTSMRGALEYLDDGDLSAEEESQFLATLSKGVSRLERLVHRFLELARADSVRHHKGVCDVVEVARDVGHELGLPIELESPKRAYRVAIAREDLRTVFKNLFSNSSEHGASKVTLIFSQDAGRFVVKCCDNGNGFHSGDIQKLFTPFFTGRREKGGTGLGLPIVKSLLERSGASIQAVESEHGACFELEIVAARLE